MKDSKKRDIFLAKLNFISTLPSDLSSKVVELICVQFMHAMQNSLEGAFEVVKAATPIINKAVKQWDEDEAKVKEELKNIKTITHPKTKNV